MCCLFTHVCNFGIVKHDIKEIPGDACLDCWAPLLEVPSALCPALGASLGPLWLTAISIHDLALGSRLGLRGGVVFSDSGMAAGLGERGLVS